MNDPERRMHFGVAVVAACCFLVGPAMHATLAADPHPRNVRVKAGLAGDEKTARTYMKANLAFVQESMPDAVRKCAATAPTETLASFDLVVTVTKGGKISGIETDPDNAFTSCVSKAIGTATLTEPPNDPTDVYVEVSMDR